MATKSMPHSKTKKHLFIGGFNSFTGIANGYTNPNFFKGLISIDWMLIAFKALYRRILFYPVSHDSDICSD